MKRRSRHRVLKLRDGTDVIGRIIKVDDGGMVLDRPMLYQLVPVFDRGKLEYLTVSFKKWFEFAKTQRYYFPKEYILAHSEPERELVKDYIQAKKTNDFIEQTVDEMEENDLQGMNVEDIMDKIQKMNPNLHSGSMGFVGKGSTASNKPSVDDEFWRGLPRFE